MSTRCKAFGAALLSALIAIAAPLFAVGPPVPAMPPNYVVDLAGVIDDGVEARTNALLRELEERTTAQVVVLTLPTLDGESLEAFSIDLAHNRWKLGQKGKDNGVLLTLAMQERKYRIEVGYGLEGVLPDSLVGSLGRQVLVPAFRAGDFGGGIAAMAGELATRVAAGSGVTLSGAPPVAVRRSGRPAAEPSPLAKGLALLLIPIFIYLLIRHPQLLIFLLLSSRGGSRGSWGGGGGGFGGGGGGGFGGGGSSGSW
ncbi:MAG: TPM domain-containing protein [Candidatus Methylomirabilia bacterium]